MKRFLLLAFLLWMIPLPVKAAGNISVDGTCSGTTSCTLSAVQAGDLKVCFAFHSASTTIPTLPGTFATVDSAATAAGGTPGAFRIGSAMASSNSDTGSGTWTNATNVSCYAFTGSKVVITAISNVTGVGGFAHNSAKTSTSLNFPANTNQATDSTSWTVGFAGSSVPSFCTPAGLSNRATASTGDVSAYDTNGSAGSYAGASCSVSSGTWMTDVLEIKSLAPIPANIVLRSGSTNQGGQVTTSITGNMPNPSLSGNYYVIGAYWDHTVGVTGALSDPSSDTFTQVVLGSNLNSSDFAIFCGQVTSTTQKPVLTFSGGQPLHAAIVFIDEVQGLASCTADGTSTNSGIGANPIQAGSLTTTAANDLVFQLSVELNNTCPVSFDSGASPWALNLVDTAPGGDGPCSGSQVQLQPSSGAINPTMYENPAPSIAVSVAVAFKTNSSGTQPSLTPRIVAFQNQYDDTGAGPFTSQFPILNGDIAYFGTVASPTCTFGTITDNYGNTWTQRGTAYSISSNGTLQSYDVFSAVGSDGLVITLPNCTNGGGGASNHFFLEITGAGSFCSQGANVKAETNGSMASGTSYVGVSVTPCAANGIAIFQEAHQSNTSTGASGCIFAFFVPNPAAPTNDHQGDNNGLCIANNSGLSAITATWTVDAAVGGWSNTGVTYNNVILIIPALNKRIKYDKLEDK